jgi:hypothetical protein
MFEKGCFATARRADHSKRDTVVPSAIKPEPNASRVWPMFLYRIAERVRTKRMKCI